MKVTYDLADVKELKLAAIGVHEAFIKDSKLAKSKAGNLMLENLWQIDGNGNESDGAIIPFDYVSFSSAASWKLDEFVDALRLPRVCLGCQATFTKGLRVPNVGIVCPECKQKTRTEFEIGDSCQGPGDTAVALLGLRCKLRVAHEPSKKDPERMNNRIDGYVPLD